MTSWNSSGRCLIIAHRGDTQAAQENTLPAVESALRLGVDGVEVDLQLTRDGEIVLFHDEDLKRLAGRNDRIEATDLSTLREIPGAGIATLEELLDLVGDKALLNLEIKTARTFNATLEKKLTRLVKSFRLADSILVSSFYPLSLWRLRRIAPNLKRGYLFQDRWILHQRIVPLVSPFSVNAPLRQASKTLADATHRAGRRFFVWTVNDENDMKQLLGEGADGLITDEPRKLLPLAKREGE